ncbi:MAG: hypothetical protein ACPG7F_05005 [Aggregatilineales bacterium]
MKQLLRTGIFFSALILLVTVTLAKPPEQLSGSSIPEYTVDARLDMELLADLAFGTGERPGTWTANVDVESQSLIADLWFDNEQLADELFGQGTRPEGWIGATTANAVLLLRNVRHDLELAANSRFGEQRPDQWIGAAPLANCTQTTMNSLYVLETVYGFTSVTPDDSPVYCTLLEAELLSQFNSLLGEIEIEDLPQQTLAVRGDLERLADEELGLGVRPAGWTDNKDAGSPTLTTDNYTDLELLADAINEKDLLPVAQRPDNWLGAVSGTSPASTFINQRRDLERLADTALGIDIRPRGWQGADALLGCDAILQSFAQAAQENFEFVFTDTGLTGDLYCQELTFAVNNIVENPPFTGLVDDSGEPLPEEMRFVAESNIAFAYLDLTAIQYMGQMPAGTEFRAWYRNFGDSTMMFVSGIDFALYIDRRWTTLSEERFNGLPTLEGVKPLTFCDANWCNGPAPTPTPTGSGPLLEIAVASTPRATPDATGSLEGKQLVSWNNIRINYVLQRPEVGRAQVTLEICNEVSQITCEAVISVFDSNTGVAVPVISVFNNLNVYELPYGYNNNILIEGSTLYSRDVWLNDPALGGGN